MKFNLQYFSNKEQVLYNKYCNRSAENISIAVILEVEAKFILFCCNNSVKLDLFSSIVHSYIICL